MRHISYLWESLGENGCTAHAPDEFIRHVSLFSDIVLFVVHTETGEQNSHHVMSLGLRGIVKDGV